MTRQIDYSAKINRISVGPLDDILGVAYPVLDHGFIRVIDYMGNDSSIAEMARVSYGEGTKAVNDNTGLIRYLMRHKHTSPFEGCEIKLHVKLPVFVARQWIRHRMANVNEISGRYSILDREFYLPEKSTLMQQSTTNKQGRAGLLPDDKADLVLRILKLDAGRAYDHYESMIYNDEDDPENSINLARELARINLPVSIYTQWYWKTDLHNLFHFLKLRADSHAQAEIRAYADVMKSLTRVWVPTAAAAAEDYIYGASTFSAPEIAVLRALLVRNGVSSQSITDLMNDRGCTKREIGDFLRTLTISQG